MKAVINHFLLFVVTIILMTGALIGTALIPRSRIQKNCEESAEQLMRRNTAYYNLLGGVKGRKYLRPGDCSKIDQIADIYLLSVGYYLDSDHPLNSVLWAKYYDGREDEVSPLKNMNESFRRAVTENVSPNKQYLRYWHGSLVSAK